MRVAAIDIGTNSVLLLIAERRGDEIVPLVERATITRLGQGVDKSRRLLPEASQRTLDCLASYAEEIKGQGVTVVAAVGTSAMRDAQGGAEFRSEAKGILGVEPSVASGREEAELTFEGALTGLALTGPVTVFDVGGGSTEIVTGDAQGGIDHATSLDVGSVRLTERHIHNDPPTEAEREAVREDVRASLVRSGIAPVGALVGVAGTVTTLAAYVRDVAPYDPNLVHGARLEREEVLSAARSLSSMSLEARRSLRSVDPKRADVIVAGAAIVVEVLFWAQTGSSAPAELIVSDRGVRWGLAQRMLRGRSD